jgi:hypothetical protein
MNASLKYQPSLAHVFPVTTVPPVKLPMPLAPKVSAAAPRVSRPYRLTHGLVEKPRPFLSPRARSHSAAPITAPHVHQR